MKPQLFSRTLFVDDRGHFENICLDYPYLNFTSKRAYICSNFEQGLVRAFHYHEKESKIFICLKGAAKFVLFEGCKTSKDTIKNVPIIFTISNSIGKAIFIPSNYANGWQSLTSDTVLLGLSNVTLEESRNDDYRFLPREIEGHHPNLWITQWR